jgi:hypothetical protein
MTARFKAACSFLRSISLRSVSLAAGCDFVVLSIAGHGVWEPEHVKAPQPDGLAGFNPKTPAANQQRIIGTEINHVIKQFESKARMSCSSPTPGMAAGSREKWIPVPPK